MWVISDLKNLSNNIVIINCIKAFQQAYVIHTLTGLPHELKSADFDIDSAIGGDDSGSITLDDCLLFTAIIAHISRHPKL